MRFLLGSGGHLALFAGLVWLLNSVWEVWHCVLFYDLSGKRAGLAMTAPAGFVWLMSYAATVDMIILVVILLGGSLLWRSWQWFEKMNPVKYGYFVGVALVWAAVIEYKGVYLLGQWQYNDFMPTVFGLGVSPLAQLWVTGLIALAVVRGGSRGRVACFL